MILIINGGSPSIKFVLYKQANQPEKIFSGQISRIGLPHAGFVLKGTVVSEV